MKFKKNAVFIYCLLAICSISWLLLIIIIVCFTNSIDLFVVLWFLFGPGIMLLCFEVISKGGLFHDTVYCDEQGITVVTRRKKYDCPWEKIKLLDQLNGAGGQIGWIIVMYSREEIHIVATPRYFASYVKKIAPYVKIKSYRVEI